MSVKEKTNKNQTKSLKLIKPQIKISIIVPVYNVQDYLKDCIESLVHQTLEDIEIICVDDASTDRSLKILEDYAQKDSRIRIIACSKNQSANITRKRGVESANGEYLMFVDADDTLALEACAELYDQMKEKNVDIIQFGTEVVNCGNLPQARIASNQRMVAPYLDQLCGEEVFKGCFIDKKYRFQLWNKIYKTSIVKKAYSYVEEASMPKAQDKYAFFLISYFAQSYLGIKNVYYYYHFGNGITGHEVLDLSTFEVYCKMGLVASAAKRFAQNVATEDYVKSACVVFVKELLNDCIANQKRLDSAGYGKGFDMMISYFPVQDVVTALAEKNWFDREKAVELVYGADALSFEKKEIKTIATYYHKLENGGAQLVVATLANLWASMGYRVIVFTDVPACVGDYNLRDGIERVVLPSYFTINKENYGQRADALQKILNEYNVDLMVYHAWASQILLWDMLICKLNHVKFLVHSHSIYSMLERNMQNMFANMAYTYTLADGIVTITRSDLEYWNNFNNNVHVVVNPSRYNDLSQVSISKLSNENIIWCQRFSSEKRPMDVIEIFQRVHASVPTANLFILGKGTTSDILNSMKKKIADYKLQDNVFMFGYQKDVQIFYEISSVCLLTSEYEGFSLSLLEALAAGIPTVMYDLPYLTVVEDGKGIIPIENRSISDAAEAVIELLRNPERRKQIGKEAREEAEKLASFDFMGEWNKIFQSLIGQPQELGKVSHMWKALYMCYSDGVRMFHSKIDNLQMENQKLLAQSGQSATAPIVRQETEKLQRENEALKEELEILRRDSFCLQETRNSFTYKIGRFMTYLPRLLRHIFVKAPM